MEKKSFNSGVIIPTRIGFFKECNKDKKCERFNNQINENKEFQANLNLVKGQFPNEFGDMLHYLKKEMICF